MKTKLLKTTEPNERKRTPRGVCAVAVVLCVLLIAGMTAVVIMAVSTESYPFYTSCEPATVKTCFTEMLEGPPSWNDTQLLEVIREDFLKPPVEVEYKKSFLYNEEVHVIQALKKAVGKVSFVVATVGANIEVLNHFLKHSKGLWIHPKPVKYPEPAPLSNLWTSHACLSPSIPYLNKKDEQCFSLASLLLAMGNPEVDLVMTTGRDLERILHPFCDLYPMRPKAVLLGGLLTIKDLPDDYLKCAKGMIHVANQYSVLFLNNASKGAPS